MAGTSSASAPGAAEGDGDRAAGHQLPARNDGVKAWDEHTADEQRVFTRLQEAFAGMLDHADQIWRG